MIPFEATVSLPRTESSLPRMLRKLALQQLDDALLGRSIDGGGQINRAL